MSSEQENLFTAIEPSATKDADSASSSDAGFLDLSRMGSRSTEVYRNQIEKNMESNRTKRLVAFVMLGLICTLYLICLLFALDRLLTGNSFVAVAALGAEMNWHVLVFLGVVLGVFAAIPLSLAHALVRMISEREPGHEGHGPMTTVQYELGKMVFDALKKFFSGKA